MSEMFSNKLLVPLSYLAVLVLAILATTALIPKPHSEENKMSRIEPAAGEDTQSLSEAYDAPSSDKLNDVETTELPPLRISPDKTEIVHLEREAINILVGNEETLRAIPDTKKSIILIPKKPGATYFKAMDANGKVIVQRHVIVGAPNKNYIRIRRACVNGDSGCKEYSIYYCPDMCYEVDVMQPEKAAQDAASIPVDAPSQAGADSEEGAVTENVSEE